MDYSKEGQGTRVLDQGKARTLATGIGQTLESNMETGSSRAQRVQRGMKPGQTAHDPLLRQLNAKADTERAMQAEMGMDAQERMADPGNAWPLRTGSRTHEQANGVEARPNDQGEESRRAVTGRNRCGGITQGPIAHVRVR